VERDWRHGVGTSIDKIRERGERRAREDRLDWEAKERTNSQRELERWIVLPPLEVANRLVVHSEGVGQLLSAHPAFSTQDRESVVELGAVWATLVGRLHRLNIAGILRFVNIQYESYCKRYITKQSPDGC
jgi:hypothetical protein